MFDVMRLIDEFEEEIRAIERETEELASGETSAEDRELIMGRHAVTRRLRFYLKNVRRAEVG